MKISNILVSVSIAFYSFVAVADNSGMKPGLWEDHFSLKSTSGKLEKKLAEIKKKLAELPPDQRKMMEAALASQGAGLTSNGDSIKICISQEQADKLDLPRSPIGRCKQEEVSRTSNSVKMKFECKGNPVTTGEGEFKLLSPIRYSSEAVINLMEDNTPDKVTFKQNGKWLSADCGNIKSRPTIR